MDAKSEFSSRIQARLDSGKTIGIDLFWEMIGLLSTEERIGVYQSFLETARNKKSALSSLDISSQKSSIV